jgi:hypothetical protein
MIVFKSPDKPFQRVEYHLRAAPPALVSGREGSAGGEAM